MKYTHRVVFYDENTKPIKLEKERALGLMKAINDARFVIIDGSSYAVRDIRRIEKIHEELAGLPEPTEKAPNKEFIEKQKLKMAEHFNW